MYYIEDDMMVVRRSKDMVDLGFEVLNFSVVYHENERKVTFSNVSNLEARGNKYNDAYLHQKSNEYSLHSSGILWTLSPQRRFLFKRYHFYISKKF